jgi:hypothetical protein
MYRFDNKTIYQPERLARFLIIENGSATDGGKIWTVPATAAGKCSSIFDGSAEAQMDSVIREHTPAKLRSSLTVANAAALRAN